MAIDNSGSSYQRGTTAAPIGNKSFFNYQGQAPGPSAPMQAFLTTALAGANNDLTYTAVAYGVGANQITVTYVVAGASTALSVSVSGNDITVNVATDSGSAATSTATQVAAAVAALPAAAALVTVANAPSNNGSGVVTAMPKSLLSGGTAKHPTIGHQPLPHIPPIHNSYS